MTLRRRTLLHIGAAVLGVVLVGAAAVARVTALHQDFGVAVAGNRQLRRVYEVGIDVASARRWLDATPADPDRAMADLQRAVAKLDVYEAGSGGVPANAPNGAPAGGWLTGSERDLAHVRAALDQATASLSRGEHDAPALNAALAGLADLAAQTRTTIQAAQTSADRLHRATVGFVLALSTVVAVAVAVAGAVQYRAVVAPLTRLGRSVRRLAGGQLDARVDPAGDEEFVALARDFNRMADELSGLCRELERRVAEASRELVRSERLASVGYLAAGVAHEINNPLGIIAGYGERSLQHLRRGGVGSADGSIDSATADRVGRALEVMCEEAFRCKGITDRLLSLARPGSTDRRPVRLGSLARDVVASIGGLPGFADRRVIVEGEGGDPLVVGRDAELKQVVLNLVINALEAVDPRDGVVRVTVRAVPGEADAGAAGDAELAVHDNGRGMTPATIERVFEPFFTDHRGRPQRPGTGLGLSIAHAIVAEHGGRIGAASAGPGRGSCLTVRLPLAPADAGDGEAAASVKEVAGGGR